MKCANCGKELKDTALFVSELYCGEPCATDREGMLAVIKVGEVVDIITTPDASDYLWAYARQLSEEISKEDLANAFARGTLNGVCLALSRITGMPEDKVLIEVRR